MKEGFRRLQESHERLEKRFASLNEAFHRVMQENWELKPRAEAYDVLCRGYGEEEIAVQVQSMQEGERRKREQPER